VVKSKRSQKLNQSLNSIPHRSAFSRSTHRDLKQPTLGSRIKLMEKTHRRKVESSSLNVNTNSQVKKQRKKQRRLSCRSWRKIRLRKHPVQKRICLSSGKLMINKATRAWRYTNLPKPSTIIVKFCTVLLIS